MLIRGTDAQLKEKAKKLDPHIIKGSHWADGDMERRLHVYNTYNNVSNYHYQKGNSMMPTVRFF